jgi:hypothetical protein
VLILRVYCEIDSIEFTKDNEMKDKTSFDIYHCDSHDTCRFSLGKKGNKILYVVGLNPSTANKEKSDKTVTMVQNIALKNNFDGFVMLNLYPLRSTDPQGLPDVPNTKLLDDNVEHMKMLGSQVDEMVIWAAWGENILIRDYLFASLNKINLELRKLHNDQLSWKNFGSLTGAGHPRHPSRASYDWIFDSFDIVNYIKEHE